MNNWVGIGRLTKDPEMRYTQSGKAVASFTLAVDREGQKDATDFVNVVAWNKTAELVTQYLAKGRQVAVNGSWQSRKYQNKEGQNVMVWEVIANRVEFIGGRESNGSNSTQSTKQQPKADDYYDDPFAD